MENKMVKLNEVDDFMKKSLDSETIFKFECDNIEEQLRIGLKEINKYSPYYFEKYYSKSDLDEINYLFRSLPDINSVKNQLIKCFAKMAGLQKAKDGKNLIICFNFPSFAETIKIDFELERKTYTDKDAGLMCLFAIQKKNIGLFKKIIEQCKKNPKEPVTKEILKLLANFKN